MYQKCLKCNLNNSITDNDLEDSIENDLDMLNECSCGYNEEQSLFPDKAVLGQSYVPIQVMDKTFKPCVGLKMGTIFPELVSPYMPGQSLKEIEYLKRRNSILEGCNKC